MRRRGLYLAWLVILLASPSWAWAQAGCFCYQDANDNMLFGCSEFRNATICLDAATGQRRVIEVDTSVWSRVEEGENACAPCNPNLEGVDRPRSDNDVVARERSDAKQTREGKSQDGNTQPVPDPED